MAHRIQLRKSAFVLALTLGLAITLGASAFGASSALANAQQPGSNIYAAADLAAEGAGPDAANGTVTFERTGGGGTRVTITLTSAQPGTEYKGEIRDGGCSAAASYSLQPVKSDAQGMGQSVSTVGAEVDFSSWYVALIADAGGSTSGPAALCGKVNPALAGAGVPPVGTVPGMPTTGQPSNSGNSLGLGLGLWLAVAAMSVAAGLCVRYLRARARGGDQW